VAACLPHRALNLGKLARPTKNTLKAASWWRSARRRDRGHLRQERQGRILLLLSARSACAHDVLLRSAAYRSYRVASVRFHTMRMQPNVRASIACCAWSG
jgi:hypothetical protein